MNFCFFEIYNIRCMQQYGKWIILIGVMLCLVGLITHFWGDKFSWVGHLPGDINIENENFRLYIPITTMLIISLIVTFIRWLFRNF